MTAQCKNPLASEHRCASRSRCPEWAVTFAGIRIRLELAKNSRDLALFNLAIDSKLRACDLVQLTVADIVQGNRIKSRASVVQKKTQQPVQFEITAQTCKSLESWLVDKGLSGS